MAAEPDSYTLRLEDGRNLHYAVYGLGLDSVEAPTHTVLYHHGWPSCRLEAAALHAHALMLKMRIIAPDRPGVGGSSYNPTGTFSSAVHDAEQLLNSLNIKQAIAMGTSGGGPYAAACAAFAGHRFSALALVASMTHAAGPGSSELCKGMYRTEKMWYTLIARAPWVMKAVLVAARPLLLAMPSIAALPGTQLLMYYMGQFGGLPKGDLELLGGEGPPLISRLVPRMLQCSVLQGVDGLLHDMRLTTLPWGFDLGHISVPSFLWHGCDDVHVPPAMGRYLAKHIPNCKAQFLEGESHGSLFARHMPDILAQLVREVAPLE